MKPNSLPTSVFSSQLLSSIEEYEGVQLCQTCRPDEWLLSSIEEYEVILTIRSVNNVTGYYRP